MLLEAPYSLHLNIVQQLFTLFKDGDWVWVSMVGGGFLVTFTRDETSSTDSLSDVHVFLLSH